jgi:hypothetical protein
MRANHYDIPAVFLSDAVFEKFREVEQFIEREARDMNPYKVQLSADELLEAAKNKFGLKACSNVEFWIH